MISFSFLENEKVLCFHGPLMYEAKVLKAEVWTKGHESGQTGTHYLVHYKGWKQSWDEWVPEERVNKFSEENIRKQKALIEAQRARDHAERLAQQKLAEAAESRKGSNGPSGSLPAGAGRREEKRGQKRGRDMDGEDEYMKRPEIKISIPDVLKVQLVDDWEAITKNNQLVNLPRDPSVDRILEEWMKFLANDDPDRRRLAAEVAAGLRLYFNKALGNNLLYRFERGQYAEMVKKATEGDVEKDMSSLYGAEHLLRLFVNLPELLAHTTMDPDTADVLKENVAGFLKWLALNKHMLFTGTATVSTAGRYMNSSSAYQNANRG